MAKKPATKSKAAKASAPPKAAKSPKAAAPLKAVKAPKPAPRAAASAAPAAPADNGAQGQYVYCIIQSETPLTFGPLGSGHEPAEVQTVHFKDLCAVV